MEGEKRILFFSEQINFNLKNKRKLKSWLLFVSNNEGKKIDNLSYIFVDDQYLLKINKQYLNHQTFTDIITFDYCENDLIAGEIYISLDRIKENAIKYKVSFETELYRVMVHGLLHLLGYKDKVKSDKQIMNNKEDEYLNVSRGTFFL